MRSCKCEPALRKLTYSNVTTSHEECFDLLFSSSSTGTVCGMVPDLDGSPGSCRAGRALIFNPDFFVEKLRHESPDVFLELVLSNITRLIDLPGTEFAQLLGEESPKTPTGGNGGFFRSFNFLKRKGMKPSLARVGSGREFRVGSVSNFL